MDRSESHQRGRLLQQMLSLARDADVEAALKIWDGLTEREKRLTFLSVVGLVNHYRSERGDDPGGSYRPPEAPGL